MPRDRLFYGTTAWGLFLAGSVMICIVDFQFTTPHLGVRGGLPEMLVVGTYCLLVVSLTPLLWAAADYGKAARPLIVLGQLIAWGIAAMSIWVFYVFNCCSFL